MRAIQISRTGGPEVLELVDLPVPKPGPGEVLVKVIASGVNFIDTYLREGRYPAPLPFVPGQEAAGYVEALGEGVTDFLEGDRVVWTGTRGTYAEYACAAADALIQVPEFMLMDDALGVLTQGLTAHYLATSTYEIRYKDTVLVHAGAGGVGLLLTQIAQKRYANVITTVSTEEKAEISRMAGADHVILYTQQNFYDEVMKITGGEKLPVVYDSVGKTTFEDSLRCLRPRGLLALYGASSGAVPPFDLIRLSTMGSLFVTRPTLKDYVADRVQLLNRVGELFQWMQAGELQVRIGNRYALEDAAQAHRDLESRQTTGKVLLVP